MEGWASFNNRDISGARDQGATRSPRASPRRGFQAGRVCAANDKLDVIHNCAGQPAVLQERAARDRVAGFPNFNQPASNGAWSSSTNLATDGGFDEDDVVVAVSLPVLVHPARGAPASRHDGTQDPTPFFEPCRGFAKFVCRGVAVSRGSLERTRTNDVG